MDARKPVILVLALVVAGLGAFLGAFLATVIPVLGLAVIVLAVVLFGGGILEASLTPRAKRG